LKKSLIIVEDLPSIDSNQFSEIPHVSDSSFLKSMQDEI